jgi:acyl phosphate:glycerol-3-phosphate acyltransferase
MFWMIFFGCIIFAYFLGSIPFGLVISRAYKTDIRKFGSGNIGATNVFRTLGPKAGITVFLFDFLKGFIPALLVKLLLVRTAHPMPIDAAQILVGLFAILGHIFPIYIGFKGGKGVATGAGIVFAILPIIALILIGVWGIIVFTSRYVSLGSIIVAILLPIAIALKKYVLHYDLSIYLLIFCFLITIFVIVRHKSNIKRLLNGTENRFGTKKEKVENE